MERYRWFKLTLGMMVALALVVGPLRSLGSAQVPTSGSPPLETVVQEFDPIVMPEATAYAIFTDEAATAHQVWYRVVGGDALFRQRLRVFQENAGPRPTNQLPPESQLVEAIETNTVGDWVLLPPVAGTYTYYFDGDHRITPDAPWQNGRGLVVQRTRFSNGNLFELGFEDQVSLDDYNDLQIQVAFIQP